LAGGILCIDSQRYFDMISQQDISQLMRSMAKYPIPLAKDIKNDEQTQRDPNGH
jgi:hypothetical protein